MPAQKSGLQRVRSRFVKFNSIFLFSLILLTQLLIQPVFASSGRARPTFIFSGRVLDAQTKQPLANVSIDVIVTLDNTAFSTLTDSFGRYELKIKVARTFSNPFKGRFFYAHISAIRDGYLPKIGLSYRLKPSQSPFNLDIQLVPIQPPDTIPPVITISPVSTPTNHDVVLSYAVTDNSSPQNQIIVSGNNSPYTKEGDYNVTLTAKDLASNTSTASVSFSIDKTPPKVIITSPQDGSTVNEAGIQLTGTIDGAPFSENRVLSEGTNTLVKAATDSAGNSASSSVTIYLNSSCSLIGPEGGEVISNSGKVKLVIPKNALTKPTCISISNLNNANFQSLIPKDTTLLNIVECKPYGLIFNKPVEIIYTLDTAQIPGTPVKLGVYDSGKISFTSDPAIVPADGYNISFTIWHFSTYAALRDFVSQGAPIGTGVKIPLPDLLTGAFSHSVALTVPPGRKGVQPSLALNYRSGSSNSWIGVGYSLNPGYIVRSTRLGPAKYIDTQDTFYLITDAGTIEFVNLIDNLYQAKVESSFTKYFKEADDSWRVVGKDGSILRFGQDADSEEISSSGTFAWYLTKAADTNGNFVQYKYIKDQGKPYLSRVDYTGNENGISPANSVEFSLESRDDIASSYISGSKVVTAKRLKEIQVKTGNDLVWRYALEYNYSQDTNRSLLKTVTQYGADDKSLPTQKFVYQSAK